MSNSPRFEVLCEDREHEEFARIFLKKHFQANRRRVRVAIAPDGRGSAAQWVESQFDGLVKRARSKSYQQRLRFLCVLDGEHEGFAARKKRLSEKRHDTASITIWVPTWSIESWVLWLASENKNDFDDSFETASLKSDVKPQWKALLPSAVDRFAGEHGSDDRCPSLNDARIESQRLNG